VRIVFDENTRAIRILAVADAGDLPEPLEVLHARELVQQKTPDVLLIQAVADGSHAKAALITSDKSMRTHGHERAAFTDTGCIGIVLRGDWNHAPMWDRARVTLRWWRTWVAQIAVAAPGSLWQCPWSERPKPLKRY
jgi:PIN like domain